MHSSIECGQASHFSSILTYTKSAAAQIFVQYSPRGIRQVILCRAYLCTGTPFIVPWAVGAVGGNIRQGYFPVLNCTSHCAVLLHRLV